jgi:1,4-alpha-glucan branching enzyme
MSIKKRFLKSRPECKVTFRLSGEQAEEAETVHVVGDFNDWETTATPMKKLKSGDFTVTLDLDVDQEYEFRYLIDQAAWQNDQTADRYVPTPFPSIKNSVLVL